MKSTETSASSIGSAEIKATANIEAKLLTTVVAKKERKVTVSVESDSLSNKVDLDMIDCAVDSKPKKLSTNYSKQQNLRPSAQKYSSYGGRSGGSNRVNYSGYGNNSYRSGYYQNSQFQRNYSSLSISSNNSFGSQRQYGSSNKKLQTNNNYSGQTTKYSKSYSIFSNTNNNVNSLNSSFTPLQQHQQPPQPIPLQQSSSSISTSQQQTTIHEQSQSSNNHPSASQTYMTPATSLNNLNTAPKRYDDNESTSWMMNVGPTETSSGFKTTNYNNYSAGNNNSSQFNYGTNNPRKSPNNNNYFGNKYRNHHPHHISGNFSGSNHHNHHSHHHHHQNHNNHHGANFYDSHQNKKDFRNQHYHQHQINSFMPSTSIYTPFQLMNANGYVLMNGQILLEKTFTPFLGSGST
jgi:hypothetical protein